MRVIGRVGRFWLVGVTDCVVGGSCHEESRRFRLMRNRLGDVDDDDVEEEEDEDIREASRSRASWFLYQRILSAEMRMKSFLGWSGPALCRLEGRGEVTRAILFVYEDEFLGAGWVGCCMRGPDRGFAWRL